MKVKWSNFLPSLWVIVISLVIALFSIVTNKTELRADTVTSHDLSKQVTNIEVAENKTSFAKGDILLVTINFKADRAVEPGDFIEFKYSDQAKGCVLEPVENSGNLVVNNERIGKFELDDNKGKLTFQKITCFNKGKFTFAAVVTNANTDKYLDLQAGQQEKIILIKHASENKEIKKVGRIEGNKIFWTTFVNLSSDKIQKDLLVEEQVFGNQNLNEKSVEITNLNDVIELGQVIRPRVNEDENSFCFSINDHDLRDAKYKVTYTTSINSDNDYEKKYLSKTRIISKNGQEVETKLGQTFEGFILEDQVQFKKNEQFEDLKNPDKETLLTLLFKYFQDHLRNSDSNKEATEKSKPVLKDGKAYPLPSTSNLEALANRINDQGDTEVPIKSKINLNKAKKHFNQIRNRNIKPKSLSGSQYSYHRNRNYRFHDSDQGERSYSRNQNHRNLTHKLPQAGAKNELYFCLLGIVIFSVGFLIQFLFKKNH